MCIPRLNGRRPLGPDGCIYRTKVPRMDSRFRGNDGVTGLLPVARGLAPRSSVRHRNSGACHPPVCAPPLRGACPPLLCAPPLHGGLSHARLCSAVARGLAPAYLCSAVARGLVPRSQPRIKLYPGHGPLRSEIARPPGISKRRKLQTHRRGYTGNVSRGRERSGFAIDAERDDIVGVLICRQQERARWIDHEIARDFS